MSSDETETGFQAGFAVAILCVTVAYATLTGWASSRWSAHAPKTSNLAQAEQELRARVRSRRNRNSRSRIVSEASDEASMLGMYNSEARDAELREAALPLRIARSRVASHGPIMPSTRAAHHELSVRKRSAEQREERPHDDAAPSPFDLTASDVIQRGGCRDLPASVAIPLLSSPSVHNRWRDTRARHAEDLATAASLAEEIGGSRDPATILSLRDALRAAPDDSSGGAAAQEEDSVTFWELQHMSTSHPANGVAVPSGPHRGAATRSPTRREASPPVSNVLRAFQWHSTAVGASAPEVVAHAAADDDPSAAEDYEEYQAALNEL